jgi:hypothetical protein
LCIPHLPAAGGATPALRGGCDALGGHLGLGAHQADLRRPRDVAHEAQPGRGLGAAAHARHAALVEHVQVPDDRLEAGAVAGGCDHGVRLDAHAVGQADARGVERLHAGDDLDAALLDRLDDHLVHDRGRDLEPRQAGEDALLGSGQAVLGQVADLEAPDQLHHAIRAPRAELHQLAPEQRADRRADQEVRRCAHRDPDALDARVDEVVGDLHARAAGADHEHVAVAKRLGVAVGGGVDELAVVGVAPGPVRDVGRVGVAAREDHLLRVQVAARGAQLPAGAVAVDALDARVEAHVHVVEAGVVLEVGDDLVPLREGSRRARPARAGERREPAARVEPEAVVAPAPGRRDGVRALQDGGGDVEARELRGGRQPRRAGSNDHNLSFIHDGPVWDRQAAPSVASST